MPAKRKTEKARGNTAAETGNGAETSATKGRASKGTRKTAKRPAGTKTAASKRVRTKTTTALSKMSARKGSPSRANGSDGRASTRPPTREARKNEKVSELAAQTMRDYNEAKKVLSTLWKDVAKTTYSAFNTVATNVEKRFEESRKTISEIDVRYALERSQTKLKQVGKSTSAVAQSMLKQVKLLYQMLRDSTSGRFKAPWATVSAITAALLYFISPIDLLPDFIPGAGLIDDALVISLCISMIRMDLKRYAQEMDLDLSDYGLSKK